MPKHRTKQAAQIDRGTPELQRKRGEPTMDRLLRLGKIGGEEQRAAIEIESVYSILCRRLFAKGSRYGERLDQSGDHEPVWFEDAYSKRYKPWADDFGSLRHQGSIDAHGHNICITLLCDPTVLDHGTLMTATDIDHCFGWRKNTACRIFIRSLRLYVMKAGWASRQLVEDWTREAQHAA